MGHRLGKSLERFVDPEPTETVSGSVALQPLETSSVNHQNHRLEVIVVL